jgi:hypothetical protein
VGYRFAASLHAVPTLAVIEEWSDWRRDADRLRWERRRP